MSAYFELKRDFRKLALSEGATSLRHVEGSPNGRALLMAAGVERAGRWLEQLVDGVREPGQQPTLVNHFALGADPELYLTQRGNRYVPANDVNLYAGKAFGADNNGRLVELRPEPSRSAVAVVASIYETLHWLRVYLADKIGNDYPLDFMARPYEREDGLGGHVHFGRKRQELRRSETQALDTVTYASYQIGLFPATAVQQRVAARYGQFGDIRPQRHGYEYRTMPTWLDSPRLAHLMITLAKLAVVSPDNVRLALPTGLTPAEYQRRVQVLLAYYRDVDDDAAIALKALRQLGWPVWQGKAINAVWGLGTPDAAAARALAYVPASIRPHAASSAAMLAHLRTGQPLPAIATPPTWQASLPEGLYDCVRYLRNGTYHSPGVGELVNDLVTSQHLELTSAGRWVAWSSGQQAWKPAARAAIQKAAPHLQFRFKVGDHFGLSVPVAEDWTRERAALRNVLLCGVFPIWRVSEANAVRLATWRAVAGDFFGPVVAKQKLYGKQL